MVPSQANRVSYPFLADGGEMGELTRHYDWAKTSLGSPDQWPLSLRTLVHMMLMSRFPMLIFWGPELRTFYNNAFRPSLGDDGKHPSSLGQRGEESWAESWPTIGPMIYNIMAGGDAVWFEDQKLPLYRDGQLSYAYWTYSFSPLLDDTGTVNGILVTCSETTKAVESVAEFQETNIELERLLEQNRLLRQEEQAVQRQLSTLFEQSQVAIAIIDQDKLTLRMVNPFYAQLVGRKVDDIIDKPLLDALPELQGQGFDDLIQKVIETGIPYIAEEVAVDIVHQNQLKTIYVDLAYQPQYEADRTISGVFVIATDVTQQVRSRREVEASETRLRRLSAELEQQVQVRTAELQASVMDLRRSNENLQQFAYIASHDLQEPLRKIQSFGDLLKTQYADRLGEGTTFLERMQTAAGRMSTLIKDLLTFSRISTQQDTTAPVSLASIVDTVLGDLEIVIRETGAEVTLESLPTVAGDASQLGQLFQNLLSNALKFHQLDITPAIAIRCQQVAIDELPNQVRPARTVEAYYRIDVSDNGIGFDRKYADRIFQVFQRLHSKNQYAGTGIGLAICEKVAANHGGTITADSQPNHGSTFSVYLPV